jgi:hypothetical protein
MQESFFNNLDNSVKKNHNHNHTKNVADKHGQTKVCRHSMSCNEIIFGPSLMSSQGMTESQFSNACQVFRAKFRKGDLS